jgi:hypothetical protein
LKRLIEKVVLNELIHVRQENAEAGVRVIPANNRPALEAGFHF